MIRPAQVSDIDRALELGAAMHAVSSYADVSFNADKVRQLMQDLIDGAGVLFVAERNGVVVGGLAGGVQPYWFSDELVGFDYSLLMDPASANGITALRLIEAFTLWCKAKGAKKVKMGITTGLNVEKMTKLYMHAGFTQDGNLFSLEL